MKKKNFYSWGKKEYVIMLPGIRRIFFPFIPFSHRLIAAIPSTRNPCILILSVICWPMIISVHTKNINYMYLPNRAYFSLNFCLKIPTPIKQWYKNSMELFSVHAFQALKFPFYFSASLIFIY